MDAETKALLIESIEAAQGPGQCRYVTDNLIPCCVVGQYATRVGVSPLTLKRWDDESSGKIFGIRGTPEVLEKHIDILQRLQDIWDSSSGGNDADSLRERMREVVK